MLYVDLIYLAQDRAQWRPLFNNVNESSGTPFGGEFSGSYGLRSSQERV